MNGLGAMCFGFQVMIRQTRDLAYVADRALAAWGGWIEPRDLPEQIRAFVERVGSLATLWKAWVGCPPKRQTFASGIPVFHSEDSYERKNTQIAWYLPKTFEYGRLYDRQLVESHIVSTSKNRQLPSSTE